jgi:hypothetical protein
MYLKELLLFHRLLPPSLHRLRAETAEKHYGG